MNVENPRPLRSVVLHDGIIYGPVRSRRLGQSLGLNILGAGGRVCPFNCVYCQLRDARRAAPTHTYCEFDCVDCDDSLTDRMHSSGTRPRLPSVDTVLEALERALLAHDQLNSITFSGNGEPTVHPAFAEIAEGTRRLRDRLAPGAMISLLSNSTTLGRPSVARGMAEIDLRVMKLDAGNDTTFERVNRPCRTISRETVVADLKSLGHFALQTMLFQGPGGNAGSEDLDNWMEAVSELKPDEIQLYTVTRIPAETSVLPLSVQALGEIAASVRRRTDLNVVAYS